LRGRQGESVGSTSQKSKLLKIRPNIAFVPESVEAAFCSQGPPHFFRGGHLDDMMYRDQSCRRKTLHTTTWKIYRVESARSRALVGARKRYRPLPLFSKTRRSLIRLENNRRIPTSLASETETHKGKKEMAVGCRRSTLFSGGTRKRSAAARGDEGQGQRKAPVLGKGKSQTESPESMYRGGPKERGNPLAVEGRALERKSGIKSSDRGT